MKLTLDQGEAAARDLATSIADEVGGPEMQAFRRETRETAIDRDAPTFFARMATAGLIGCGWPEPWGRGWRQTDMFFRREVLDMHGMPAYGLSQNEGIGSMILRNGSPELIAEHMPDLVAGNRRYVQGLSEPDAGSDLFSIRTSARREGDELVINGEKLWTSSAHIADWISVLVRTDPAASRSRGLSMVLVPARTEGITISPVWVMGGWHVNACAFEDVRVPISNVVGDVNDGWGVLSRRLDDERAMSFGGNDSRLLLQRLIHATQQGDVTLDEGQLQALGELVTEAESDRLLCLRVAAMAGRNEDTTGVAATNKLSGSLLAQRVAQFVVDALAPDSMYGDGSSQLARDAEEALRVTTVLTIMGGTSEIQRNSAAQRGLGLTRSTR